MTREQASAILSLSRQADWEKLMDYIREAVGALETNAMFMDPNDANGIARLQGARNSLANVLIIEETAQEIFKPEEDNE